MATLTDPVEATRPRAITTQYTLGKDKVLYGGLGRGAATPILCGPALTGTLMFANRSRIAFAAGACF